MPLQRKHQKYRHDAFGAVALGCLALLLGLLGLWGFGIIGSWGGYGLILLCPLVYLFLMRWGYEHSNGKPTTPSHKPPLASKLKQKTSEAHPIDQPDWRDFQ